MSLAWELQEGETPRAYQAFLIYLELGPKRSYRETAFKLNGSYHSRGIQKWATQNNWQDRVKAFDSEKESTRLNSKIGFKVSEKAQEQVIQDMLDDYAMMLGSWREEFEKQREIFSADEIIKFISARKSLNDMGRQAVGLSTRDKGVKEPDKPGLPDNQPIQFRIPGKVKNVLDE